MRQKTILDLKYGQDLKIVILIPSWISVIRPPLGPKTKQ